VVYRNPDLREGQSQKGTDYADSIVEFMNEAGYKLVSRAEDFGEQEDLVFEPIVGEQRPVVAEAKSRDEDSKGFSPNDYRRGLAERFREWYEGSYRGYRFHLFFEVESNQTLWRDLFDNVELDEVERFYKKIIDEVSTDGEPDDLEEFITQHDHSLFSDFLGDSVVWAGLDRSDLARITERIEESGEYDANPYLESFSAVQDTGILSTNLIEATSLPESLYRFSAVENSTTKSFHRYDENNVNPVYFHGGYVYSLIDYSELPDATKDFCDGEDSDEMSFKRLAAESPSADEVNISKVLLKNLIVKYVVEHKNQIVHVTRERGDTRLYVGYDEDYEVSNRSLIFELDKYEGYRHRAVALGTEYFDGSYYYTLVPKMEFTFDGEEPVPGDLKSQRAADFNPGRIPEQNKRKSKIVRDWVDVITPDESLAVVGAPEPIQQLSLRWINELKLERARPPRDGDEREELIESEIAELMGEVDADSPVNDKAQELLDSSRWSE